jgi:hypothetical protein
VLLAARLAPDMFPLTRQVQIACDHARNSLAGLAGHEPPRFADTAVSVGILHARSARLIDYLKSLPAGAREGAQRRNATSRQRAVVDHRFSGRPSI